MEVPNFPEPLPILRRAEIPARAMGTNVTTTGALIASTAGTACGDLAAIREVIDRLEGKPRQAVEHSERMTLEELVLASFASSPATEG